MRLLHYLGRAVCALLFVTSLAIAQTSIRDADGHLKYEEWGRVAQFAEQTLESEAASTASFEELRTELTGWRLGFETGQSINSERIETLSNQIEALGEAPDEGTSEPTELAERRADLEKQLSEALAPVRQAEEAYTRADGLVREVDSLIRERQTDRILRLDPSPLNPASWRAASLALLGISEAVKGEIANALNSPSQVTRAKENLPLALLLLVVGLVLVIRSGAWTERSVNLLRGLGNESRASIRLAAFAASAFAVILPVVGLIALLQAAVSSGMLGAVGTLILNYFVGIIFTIVGARWLGRQVFPKGYPPRPILPLTPYHLREGRLYTGLLGGLAGHNAATMVVANEVTISSGWGPEILPALRFPTLLIVGIVLFRMGQLLYASKTDLIEEAEGLSIEDVEYAPGTSIVSSLSRACMMIGIIGPVLAAIGYVTASGTLLISSVLTIGLIGIVAVLQRFMRDVFAVFIGDDATGSALLPVLVGFALVLIALPILALIWGARLADLSEMWEVVRNGFTIGESTISPTDFLTFAVLFVLGYGATRLLQGTLRTQVLPRTKIDTGGRNAIVAGTGYVGIFLAAVLAITGAGIDLSSLAIVAGALSVGIGFGLQTIVSNFVSGIILLIERPISEGDWIEVGNTMGVVKDISVRATRVETFDRTDVIVPNADLISNSVVNWTKGNLSGRLILPVGVAYGTDSMRVEKVLREIAESHPNVILNPPPSVLFMNFGADALEFEMRMILRDVNYMMQVRSEINHQISKRFAEEEIEIPFAQRDLWLRNPEALHGTTTSKKPT
ncbi:MAG: DUF3772 domain-containing protein [Litoreibacter sp.]